MQTAFEIKTTPGILDEMGPVIFGTSGLGNLYEAVPYATKLAIVKACVENAPGMPVFDSAGKYGAGLSLQVLGQCLMELGISPDKVIISNKLGWVQTPLTTPEPTFEKGVWKDIHHDAVQKISYDGILECFYQGNELLGGYMPQMVSVHDPDEYLSKATSKEHEDELYHDILEAYRALAELKAAGKVAAIGVGSKHWDIIKRISDDVALDWVMVANSLTLHSHPAELIDFIASLEQRGVFVINSAVFNGGYLIGGSHYNYAPVDTATLEGEVLDKWREGFFTLCKKYNIDPAEACFSFSFNVPGVKSIALSTTKPEKVKRNINMATSQVPPAFWEAMVTNGLLEPSFLPVAG
ncbi:aldo/keto reductase [Parasediminibacterium sp. JCM 36343]|uniref:aldo/keto reductase n=1 Tax=Parasediminibacterium sp. JCM 36343 TaxID=3374279 RepID=UPI00397991D6